VGHQGSGPAATSPDGDRTRVRLHHGRLSRKDLGITVLAGLPADFGKFLADEIQKGAK